MRTEQTVKERYAEGAQRQVADLCCPVEYDPKYLEVIPQEVIERDYGCGDPSRHLNPGETVLDLGSGTGKICFIASQVVGKEGKVIGVDMTDDMLDVARRHAPTVAERIGYDNVNFVKGRIQDLGLDLEAWQTYLQEHPITDTNGYLQAEELAEEWRRNSPAIADGSIDVVVSNCVLNLVAQDQREQLFRELHRVLRVGGRAVISDIVSDDDVPVAMQHDEGLWSGCISGAYREDDFMAAFEEAGFHGVRLVKREFDPWQTVEGIEFRSVTIEATKDDPSECLERRQAVIYKGPFKQVTDDDGNVMERGKRYAVCDKTFRKLVNEPYADAFYGIAPREEVPLDKAQLFDCSKPVRVRMPAETKGLDFKLTQSGQSCC